MCGRSNKDMSEGIDEARAKIAMHSNVDKVLVSIRCVYVYILFRYLLVILVSPGSNLYIHPLNDQTPTKLA